MEAFYGEYLDRLGMLHAELAAALRGLPLEGLDWTPAPGTNSLGALAVHVAGAERYWLGDVVASEPSGRDRDAEFRTRGEDAQALLQRLEAALTYAARVLEGLRREDLTAVRVSPRDGRGFTVGWCLAHVLGHTGIHAGHAQITRQLWEQRK